MATTQPEHATTVLSPAATELFAQVREFMSTNDVTALVIENEEQAKAAATIGNELQKHKRAVEAQRKAEVKPLDDRKKVLQDHFNGMKEQIDEKLGIIGQSVGVWNQKVRKEIEEAVRTAELEVDQEHEKMEAEITDHLERAKTYLEDAATLMQQAADEENERTKNVLMAKAHRKNYWGDFWTRKAAASVDAAEEAAQAPAPPPPTPAPVSPKGTRTRTEINVQVSDKATICQYAVGAIELANVARRAVLLARECCNPEYANDHESLLKVIDDIGEAAQGALKAMENADLHYLDVNMGNVKKYITMTDGQKNLPGIIHSKKEVTGFSGR